MPYVTGTSSEFNSTRQPPVALVYPTTSSVLNTSPAILDGSYSADPEGGELTFSWEVILRPVGASTAGQDIRPLDQDKTKVAFFPTIPGLYRVRLTVTNEAGQESSVLSDVASKISIGPDGSPASVPDMSFLWQTLPNFWESVGDKKAVEAVWSAYAQAIAPVYMGLLEHKDLRSPFSSPNSVLDRWVNFNPTLKIGSEGWKIELSPLASGKGSTLNLGSEVVRAVVLDNKTLKLVDKPGILSVTGQIKVLKPDTGWETLKIKPSHVPTIHLENVFSTSTKKNFFFLAVKAGTKEGTFTGDMSVGDVIVYKSSLLVVTACEGNSFTCEQTITEAYQGTADRHSSLDLLLNQKSEESLTLDSSPGSLLRASISNGFSGTVLPGKNKVLLTNRLVFNELSVGDSVTISQSGSKFSTSILEILAEGTVLSLKDSVPFSINSYISLNKSSQFNIYGKTIRIESENVEVENISPANTFYGPKDLAILKSPVLSKGEVNWRYINVLETTDTNWESLGVSSGDLLTFKVTRKFTGQHGFISCLVYGSEKRKIFFGVHENREYLDDLQEKEKKFSSGSLQSLFSDVGLSDVSVDINGDPVFSGSAKSVVDSLSAQNLLEVLVGSDITSDTEIVAAGISFSVAPYSVTRKTKIPIGDDVLNVPVLLNRAGYEVTADGYILPDGSKAPTAPVVLRDGFDYVLEGARNSPVGVYLSTTAGSPVAYALDSQMALRRFQKGDILQILSTSQKGLYRILSVDGYLIRVDRAFTDNVTQARYRLLPKEGTSFLSFRPGVLDSWDREDTLWAESVYRDSASLVSGYSSKAVGITAAEVQGFESQEAYTEVASAAARLAVLGKSPDKIIGPVSVLMGAPVSLRPSIVVDMYPSGRDTLIVLNELDDSGQPTAKIAVHRVSVTNTVELAINPLTQKPIQVGDILGPYTPLSTSVAVREMGRESLNIKNRHRARVTFDAAGTDPARTAKTIQIVNELRPAHIDLQFVSRYAFLDTKSVVDQLNWRAALRLVETFPVNSTPNATDSGIVSDASPLSVVLHVQSGLDIAEGGLVTWASGGFVFTPVGHNYEASRIRVGDILEILSGPNKGFLEIDEIISDSVVQVYSIGFELADQKNASFRVWRESPVEYLSVPGVTLNEDGDLVAPVGVSWIEAGIQSGDLIYLEGDGFSVVQSVNVQYGINTKTSTLSVVGGALESFEGFVRIWRPSHMRSFSFSGVYDDSPFSISQSGLEQTPVFPGDLVTCRGSDLRVLSVVSGKIILDRAIPGVENGESVAVNLVKYDLTVDLARTIPMDTLRVRGYSVEDAQADVTGGVLTGTSGEFDEVATLLQVGDFIEFPDEDPLTTPCALDDRLWWQPTGALFLVVAVSDVNTVQVYPEADTPIEGGHFIVRRKL